MSDTTEYVYIVLDDDNRLEKIFSTKDKAEDWLNRILYQEDFTIVEVILDEDAKLKETKHEI